MRRKYDITDGLVVKFTARHRLNDILEGNILSARLVLFTAVVPNMGKEFKKEKCKKKLQMFSQCISEGRKKRHSLRLLYLMVNYCSYSNNLFLSLRKKQNKTKVHISLMSDGPPPFTSAAADAPFVPLIDFTSALRKKKKKLKLPVLTAGALTRVSVSFHRGHEIRRGCGGAEVVGGGAGSFDSLPTRFTFSSSSTF